RNKKPIAAASKRKWPSAREGMAGATTDPNAVINAEVIALRERVAFLESQVSSLHSQLSTGSLQDASEMMAIDSLFSGPDDMTDLFAFLQGNPIEANALPSSTGIPNFEIQPPAGSAIPFPAQPIPASDPMITSAYPTGGSISADSTAVCTFSGSSLADGSNPHDLVSTDSIPAAKFDCKRSIKSLQNEKGEALIGELCVLFQDMKSSSKAAPPESPFAKSGNFAQ
ncbi:hypothetical protein HDU98_005034, partial [Podochytrium sp. JEL0797]